jgi:hypothetical protein
MMCLVVAQIHALIAAHRTFVASQIAVPPANRAHAVRRASVPRFVDFVPLTLAIIPLKARHLDALIEVLIVAGRLLLHNSVVVPPEGWAPNWIAR